VFVIPAFEVHTGEPAARNGLGYQVLYLRPATLAGLLAGTGAAERGLIPRPADLVRLRAAAAGALQRFHQAMTGPAPPLARQHALLTATVALAREYSHSPSPPRREVLPEHRAVRRARDYLHARPADPVTLRDLAEVSGLSMYRLARTFKAETGLAPHAYQIQLRVLRAKRLLATGHSIAETAADCGFFDQAHLTSQFKRHVGVTPGSYARGSSIRPRPPGYRERERNGGD
jgi:AraC-like DNA-binding protein